MMSPKRNLKKLRDLGTADASFKLALRSKLMAMKPVLEYRTRRPVMRYMLVFTVLALVIVLSTSSYAYASTAVTEGDTLYPVKTTIESLEGTLARSPEAQAKFKAKIANRRLQEAGYQLDHRQRPVPTVVDTIDQATEDSVKVLQEFSSETPTELTRTHVKERLHQSMEDFRQRVETSDLSDDQKQEYLDMLDNRLEQLQKLRNQSNRQTDSNR